MDGTDSETTSIELTSFQDQNQPLKGSAEMNISNDSKENVCEKLEENITAIKTETLAIQKETIEILKVELVAPWKDHVSDKVEYDKDALVVEKENTSLSPSTEVVENATQNQTTNDATVEANGLETNEENAEFTEAKVCPNRNLDEPAPNTSDALGASISSGLSLLAQYHSDDDTDSVIEVPTISAQDYRNNVIEIDSDSDSVDSTDSSGVEYLSEIRKTIEKRIVADDDEEDEDDNEGNTGKKKHHTKLKVKGEMLLEDLPLIQDLQITVPEDECIEFGKIHSIVDQLVLISALPNSILLNLETVIFLDKGQKVLGEVFDVLGQVADPLYCVRFNSNKQIKEKQINIGDLAYIAPKTQYTQYVILSNLMKLKGSDASWENDKEPPPRFLDYSDDEQEQLARRQLRNKDRPIDNEDPTKKHKTMDDYTTGNRSHISNTHQRNRQSIGVPVGHSNDNTSHCYGGPHQNQQRAPNQYRNSWHSNYSPQSFPVRQAGTHAMHSRQNHPQSSQTYPPHMPVYTMPLVHNMSYPPPQPMQYGAPPMFHQHGHQLMQNAFSVRPPTLHGPPHASDHHQYTPTTPPGSQ